MDTLRSTAHLQREIGDDLFKVLVSSDNTEAVRQFAQKLAAEIAIPTEMIIAGHSYDILSFLQEGEEYAKGEIMIARAKEMNANLGEEDARHILEHQDEIPVALRGKVVFVFPDWRLPARPDVVYYVGWRDSRWGSRWGWLARDFSKRYRLLRRN